MDMWNERTMAIYVKDLGFFKEIFSTSAFIL